MEWLSQNHHAHKPLQLMPPLVHKIPTSAQNHVLDSFVVGDQVVPKLMVSAMDFLLEVMQVILELPERACVRVREEVCMCVEAIAECMSCGGGLLVSRSEVAGG